VHLLLNESPEEEIPKSLPNKALQRTLRAPRFACALVPLPWKSRAETLVVRG
jgi:hypothetical protein